MSVRNPARGGVQIDAPEQALTSTGRAAPARRGAIPLSRAIARPLDCHGCNDPTTKVDSSSQDRQLDSMKEKYRVGYIWSIQVAKSMFWREFDVKDWSERQKTT